MLETWLMRYPGATPVFADDPPRPVIRVVAPPVAAAPAPAAPVASKPTLPPLPLSPAKAEPPKRKPFAKALERVCGPHGPWSLPEAPKQAGASDQKRKPFERALETVCPSKPGLSRPWSLPNGRAG